MGVHQFLGEGGHKKIIYGELPEKGGHGQFAGGLAKNKEEGVFEAGWYLDVQHKLILVHAGT